MAEHSTLAKKESSLHSQAREIIANVIAFIKSEAVISKAKQPKVPLASNKQHIAAMGISANTYAIICKEVKSVYVGASISFSTPRKERAKYQSESELVKGEKHATCEIIHNFHVTQKRAPTVKHGEKSKKKDSYGVV